MGGRLLGCPRLPFCHAKESLEPERPRDVVDHLLLAMGDLGPKRLHMALVDLFIGGTETTAALLAWACAFLVRHPEVGGVVGEAVADVWGCGWSCRGAQGNLGGWVGAPKGPRKGWVVPKGPGHRGLEGCTVV